MRLFFSGIRKWFIVVNRICLVMDMMCRTALLVGCCIMAYVTVATAQAQTSSVITPISSSTSSLPLNESATKNTTIPINCDESGELVPLECINKKLLDQNSSLLQLFVIAALSGAWILYLTFFHCRLFALILTKIFNQFYKGMSSAILF